MSREAALARLAEARGLIARMGIALDDTLDLFLEPYEDQDKEDRSQAIDGMVEDAGRLSRTLELVQDEGFDFEEKEEEDDDEEDE